jgi:hypothetical protein
LINVLRRCQEIELNLGDIGRYRILIGPHEQLLAILKHGATFFSRILIHVQSALTKRVLLEFRVGAIISLILELISGG